MCSACVFVHKRRVAYFGREQVYNVLVIGSVASYTPLSGSVLDLKNFVLKTFKLASQFYDSFRVLMRVQLVLLRDVAKEYSIVVALIHHLPRVSHSLS